MPTLKTKKRKASYFQWQYKRLDAGKWVSEKHLYSSFTRALHYLEIVSECTDCVGHRLLEVREQSKYRVLYAIPCKKGENANTQSG